ncbi:hypothetical protein AI29_05740 [bacteria symbiont BFo2 of Frankliniella occidentalis]|nr:hypothetical protein AI29_05740 [bacteria symbiont BFo2 of Frankliniella occidentalis]KYP93508.1 hypothetical protein WB60_03040 [bacteria symbiont BFo2 of Frankliniella occidentalis]KYP93603.1 hypothetical protein WB67_13345 [bacteria symbiont BFo2 of Frankliniella occidentalis]
MADYGFRFRDANGAVTCETESVLSQVLGTFQLSETVNFMTGVSSGSFWKPQPNNTGNIPYKFSGVISGLNFGNGTPYIFFLPASVTSTQWSPDVVFNGNSISLTWRWENLSCIDELNDSTSDLIAVYGVYNG